jgi:hypothetical protein
MTRCKAGSASASSSATTARYFLSSLSPPVSLGIRRITASSRPGTSGASAERGMRNPATLTEAGEAKVHVASSLVISTASPSLSVTSRARRLARLVPERIMQRKRSSLPWWPVLAGPPSWRTPLYEAVRTARPGMVRRVRSTCGRAWLQGVNRVASRPRSHSSSIARPRPCSGKAQLENRATVMLGAEVAISHPFPKADLDRFAKHVSTKPGPSCPSRCSLWSKTVG